MVEKIVECFQKQTKLEYHDKKRRPKLQKFQPIEYVDLIPPKEEKDSTDNEDEFENQRLKFFVKTSRVKSNKLFKDNDQIQDDPIIKDLIINKEEYIAGDKQDSRGFEAVDNFFKQQD